MTTVDKWGERHICPKKWKQYISLPEEEKRSMNGWHCGRKFEAYIQYNKADGEEVISGQSNSRIVLGRDRTSSKASGYGGHSGTHCAMIDLVAGTHGQYAKECDEQGIPILADPSFKADSARVYITQKCDIDEAFALRLGRAGRPRNKSAVAIKADNIRIIAREGIKLVTGTDDQNSQGGPTRSITGIDLIAGNDDSDMQPLVKGEELLVYLDNITHSIQELSGIVNHFWTLFLRLEAVLAGHMHTMVPGACMAGPVPVAGITGPSIEMIAITTANACEEMAVQLPNEIINKINTAMQQIDHWIRPLTDGKTISLNPFAQQRGRLLSRKNFTN